MPSLGSVAGVFGVLELRLCGSIQMKKSWVLVSSTGVFFKGCTRGGPWEVGRLLLTRAAGEVVSGTSICLALEGCYLGHVCQGSSIME